MNSSGGIEIYTGGGGPSSPGGISITIGGWDWVKAAFTIPLGNWFNPKGYNCREWAYNRQFSIPLIPYPEFDIYKRSGSDSPVMFASMDPYDWGGPGDGEGDFIVPDSGHDMELVGRGIYTSGSLAVGPGVAGDQGYFEIFSQPDKYFTFKDFGSAIGFDAGVSGGFFWILGPSNLKGLDLSGWSVGVSGGAGPGELSVMTSGTRDGWPTYKYFIVGGGASFSITGGSYSPSYTWIEEHAINSSGGMSYFKKALILYSLFIK